jgi:hypothetical protein
VRLSGRFGTANLTVDGGASIAVDRSVTVDGRLLLTKSTASTEWPTFAVPNGTVLTMAAGAQLSLGEFNSFTVARGASLISLGPREEGDPAVWIVRREPASVTYVHLPGTIVWDRPTDATSLLLASVRQIGSGSVCDVSTDGTYVGTMQANVVALPANATGEAVHVILAVAPRALANSELQGEQGGGDDGGSGDNSTAIVVAVVVVTLCLLASIVVLVVQRHRAAQAEEKRGDAYNVTARPAQYFAPDLAQPDLVGVRVMGGGDEAPTGRSRKGSSHYTQPSRQAVADPAYHEPAATKGDDYTTVAADGRPVHRRSRVGSRSNSLRQSTSGRTAGPRRADPIVQQLSMSH